MKNIAVIPARGGSKRLHRKNIIDFCGKPMLVHTVEAALSTQLFQKVVVSTEDCEIADIAYRAGAVVDMRAAYLSSDTATVAEVCLDYLSREASAGHEYDALCCCYATAPMRTAKDIVETMSLLEVGKCDFSVAITNFSHYPHQALNKNIDGYLVPVWPEIVQSQAKSMGEIYAGNGSTYAVNVNAFLKFSEFYGPLMKGYFMPFMRSIDIDSYEDYELALAIAKYTGFSK
ncbi:acylneuraminate cytidylyltransferase family protein [Deefgea piscis]|uniref:Acylneuraminate cytidylyltransferase family protein n=1 Tax=Deefgea piscis TaxID=2739061 RepID=A0A6M8SXC6_9NEIS|nr:acylneuraminate cytidylyltransferase family protein [Deefgea piscis]QKJ67900.1 acylneuraminate cytidylyltransferase family protein [Deefgea piscis]